MVGLMLQDAGKADTARGESCEGDSKAILFAIVALVGGSGAVLADVKPTRLFGDGMVLQHGMPVPVWGTADAAEKVTVTP